MKRIIAAAMVICFFLSGCGVINDNEEQGRYIPASTLNLDANSNYGRSEKLAVYFMNTASNTLTAEVRNILIRQDSNPAETAVSELLKGPYSDKLLPVAPAEMKLDRIEFSREVANIYLLYDGEMQPEEKYTLELAIADTVTDILGAKYISVFYNGLQTGIMGLPGGPRIKLTGSVSDVWEQIKARYQNIPAVSGEVTETRPAPSATPSVSPGALPSAAAPKVNRIFTVLYFISSDGGYILPEVREVKYTDGNYVKALISELLIGPQNTAVMISPIANGAELLGEQLTLTEDGGYELSLDFSKIPARYDYSDQSDLLSSYAAMVYTITGFLPKIKSVKMFINGSLITQPNGDENMQRSDYFGYIGSSAPLYFADKNSGLLLEIQRSMEQGKIWSAKARLIELIKGPLSGDGDNVRPVTFSGITESDILSVDVSEDTAYVNLSQHFKDACAGISASSEMLLVYAMVNTITAMDGINKVQFLIDGVQTDTLAGHISLSGPFLRNYGIIKSES